MAANIVGGSCRNSWMMLITVMFEGRGDWRLDFTMQNLEVSVIYIIFESSQLCEVSPLPEFLIPWQYMDGYGKYSCTQQYFMTK